jgi:hypothetical protein
VKQVGSESLQVPVMTASGKQKGSLQISMTYYTQVRLKLVCCCCCCCRCCQHGVAAMAYMDTMMLGVQRPGRGSLLPLLLLLLPPLMQSCVYACGEGACA